MGDRKSRDWNLGERREVGERREERGEGGMEGKRGRESVLSFVC